ncbi:septation protein SepH [Actinotalea sp.]|uniref:septation protein SepH n=1 Tax=Actinotalea sp. TaxID=1872145 RepID=UPI002CD65990|nr:septation protein SepH [Actinotalea sp.]HQY33367.1 septation protein SepH [Actinotalea sp.]HRA51012.1 septation protein SepH [Actinotalea sp.]
MSELKLVGLHDDREHVVLEGADGQRFRLPIDDSLRAAVRRDRPQLEQVRAEVTGVLPPREIQSRIRAGASAEDVAAESGVPVEIVRRYEGPVLAERAWVATQARATRIGRDPGAPSLGDLVTDRLATRGVAPSTVGWDASRGMSGPWTVEVTFEVGDDERSARWTFDQANRSVRANDDEARWLSETDLSDEPIPRRHLAAVRSTVFDVEVDDALRPVLASVDQPALQAAPEPDPDEATHALLDDLADRRGVRQPLEESDDDEDGEEFEGFGPQHAFDFDLPGLTTPAAIPAAHPPASRPDLATDAQVLTMPTDRSHRGAPATVHDDVPAASGPVAVTALETAAPARAKPRKGRASVPSWDEIVFGAKPE